MVVLLLRNVFVFIASTGLSPQTGVLGENYVAFEFFDDLGFCLTRHERQIIIEKRQMHYPDLTGLYGGQTCADQRDLTWFILRCKRRAVLEAWKHMYIADQLKRANQSHIESGTGGLSMALTKEGGEKSLRDVRFDDLRLLDQHDGNYLLKNDGKRDDRIEGYIPKVNILESVIDQSMYLKSYWDTSFGKVSASDEAMLDVRSVVSQINKRGDALSDMVHHLYYAENENGQLRQKRIMHLYELRAITHCQNFNKDKGLIAGRSFPGAIKDRGHKTPGMWSRPVDTRCVIKTIGQRLDYKPGEVVIDYGSGCGHTATLLTQLYGVDVIGIDTSQSGISYSRRHALGHFYHVKSRLFEARTKKDLEELKKSRISNRWIPRLAGQSYDFSFFRDNSVNHFYSHGVIHYLAASETCGLIRELARILKPGGTAFLGFVNGRFSKGWDFVHELIDLDQVYRENGIPLEEIPVESGNKEKKDKPDEHAYSSTSTGMFEEAQDKKTEEGIDLIRRKNDAIYSALAEIEIFDRKTGKLVPDKSIPVMGEIRTLWKKQKLHAQTLLPVHLTKARYLDCIVSSMAQGYPLPLDIDFEDDKYVHSGSQDQSYKEDVTSYGEAWGDPQNTTWQYHVFVKNLEHGIYMNQQSSEDIRDLTVSKSWTAIIRKWKG